MRRLETWQAFPASAAPVLFESVVSLIIESRFSFPLKFMTFVIIQNILRAECVSKGSTGMSCNRKCSSSANGIENESILFAPPFTD